MVWRWDQGRTAYFDYNKILKISTVLMEFNGADMQIVDSAFRAKLTEAVELPFAPASYTVKRNYKRVFECSMLATYVGDRLVVSDICRALASGDPRFDTPDKYLHEVERRFRYPYPAFDNYADVRSICFPFIAVMKLLYAKALRIADPNASITLDEIGSRLIANNVSGLEDLDYYKEVPTQPFSFKAHSSSDQKRQVREMMSFMGQHSYLIYDKSALQLTGMTLEQCESEFMKMSPYSINTSTHNVVEDFLHLTIVPSQMGAKIELETEDSEALETFCVKEGKRTFKQHFDVERDSRLRKAYLEQHPEPICDVCGKDLHKMYPWTNNMLEIHHVLPLSSYDEKEENHKTMLDDVVGLCPSCHRAIHLFYRIYLTNYGQEDFGSAEEAREVYNEAKAEVANNV